MSTSSGDPARTDATPTPADPARAFTPAQLAIIREMIGSTRPAGGPTALLPGSPLPSTSDGRHPSSADHAQLPNIPTFTPSGGRNSGLDVLAEAAVNHVFEGLQPAPAESRSFHALGPYNPAATLLPKVVKKLLSLEFVEVNKLRADIWPDDPAPTEGATPPGARASHP